MTGFKRGIGAIFAVLALALTAPAGAQENLDSGKSGAQLFASDCAICHKSAQSLNRAGGLFGLSEFLRQHYTASRESASVLATYLESLGRPSAPTKRTGATKRTAKGDDKGKAAEKKGKPGEAKSEKSGKSGKPAEAKTSAPKTESKGESKGEPKGEPKSKSSEPKSGAAKRAKPKADEAKATAPKPDAASAAKPDKPAKPD